MTEATEQLNVKRLDRSRDDRMIAGVAGGLARYFDIHPAFYRVGFVVLTLLGGAGILIYAAAALVIPDEGREDSIAAQAIRERKERPWALIGLGLVGIALVVLLSHTFVWHSGFPWALVLIAGGAILWAQRRDRADAPTTNRGRRVLAWVGALLALIAVTAAVAVAAAFAWFDVSLSDGVGNRVYHVASARQLADRYELGVGQLDLDLRDLHLPPGRTDVDAHIGVGELRMTVPNDVTVRYDAKVKLGNVDAFGGDFNGHNAGATGVNGGNADSVLVIHARGGAGEITLRRAVR